MTPYFDFKFYPVGNLRNAVIEIHVFCVVAGLFGLDTGCVCVRMYCQFFSFTDGGIKDFRSAA